jgi:hypothetical protein
MGRTVALLARQALPGVADFEAPIPPVGRAWVRRVQNENLWIWFRWDDVAVILLTVTTSPPVPLD